MIGMGVVLFWVSETATRGTHAISFVLSFDGIYESRWFGCLGPYDRFGPTVLQDRAGGLISQQMQQRLLRRRHEEQSG